MTNHQTEPFDAEHGSVSTELSIQPTELYQQTEDDHLLNLATFANVHETLPESSRYAEFLKQIHYHIPSAERLCLLINRDKELIPRASIPFHRAIVSFTLANRAIIAQQGIIWERAVASLQSQQQVTLKDIVSAIVVPIIYRRRTIGVIYADTTQTADTFGKEQLGLLHDLAGNLSVILKKEIETEIRSIPTVFISYSSQDKEFVRRLANDLRRHQISVWYDERLHAGLEWRQQLARAINTVDVFLLVLSPQSVLSQNVLWEIERAKADNKLVVPILYQPCDIPADIAPLQYIDMVNSYEPKLIELVHELDEIYEQRR